jgi:hypothetical protein
MLVSALCIYGIDLHRFQNTLLSQKADVGCANNGSTVMWLIVGLSVWSAALPSKYNQNRPNLM